LRVGINALVAVPGETGGTQTYLQKLYISELKKEMKGEIFALRQKICSGKERESVAKVVLNKTEL